MKESNEKEALDLSTEEKIKQAARKLFTQKGFAAVRTRDIAEEAGINLALLNYYFRSKQKLFDIVMRENFREFLHVISGKVLDDSLTLEEKIDYMVEAYINMLSTHPDLPLFVLNEIRGNPSKIATEINNEVAPMRSLFFGQLQKEYKNGGALGIEPFHFVANLVGLTVFPFVGKPILQRVTSTNDEEFARHMEERKKLVPIWLKAMIKGT